MVDTLNAPQQGADFFRTYLRTRLHHWRDHAAVKMVEIATLDAEQEQILKAIMLGLDLAEAWVVVRDLIIAFAPYMERRGHWEAWHLVLQRAIGAAQRVGDESGEITLTALLAKLCQRQSRAQDVVRYYRRGIRLARRTGNRYELARACSNLGYFYIDGGRWWRSEVLSCHALATFEGLESNHGRAHTYNHLGVLAIRMKNWPAAETHLLAACRLWTIMPDYHGLITGYGNLALLYCEMAYAQTALCYLVKAEALIQETGETAEIATVWSNMAYAYRLTGEFEKAVVYASKAEEQYRERTNWHAIARVWHNLALTYLATGNLIQANDYCERARALYQQFNDWAGEAQLRKDYYELAEKQ
ncbi:MAG TPA: tetratricopeptide repeat protein [Caldilineaceae bacterium]|nr:tetratricopeptide repeat protein [Caldilineaceae bacterium]